MFLLILGPSGVGKNSLIHELQNIDDRFVYITPYTTRPPREGETEKIHMSKEEIQRLQREGKFLVVHEYFGSLYATPRNLPREILASGRFPILDWMIDDIQVMKRAFPQSLFSVYVYPPSLQALRRRLMGRQREKERVKKGEEEFRAYKEGNFDGLVDFMVCNEDGELPRVAQSIYEKFLSFLPSSSRRGY